MLALFVNQQGSTGRSCTTEREREREREKEKERDRVYWHKHKTISCKNKIKALGHRKKPAKQVVSSGAPRKIMNRSAGTRHSVAPGSFRGTAFPCRKWQVRDRSNTALHAPLAVHQCSSDIHTASHSDALQQSCGRTHRSTSLYTVARQSWKI